MSDERPWQHPAERGAEHGHGYIVNPPPLSRRFSILTAIISVFVSIAVIAVAIPKGISEYADDADPQTSSTTTVPRVKGALQISSTVVSGGSRSTSALSLGNGYWLTSTEALGASTTFAVHKAGVRSAKATVVAAWRDSGMAVIRTREGRSTSGNLDPLILEDPRTLADLSKYWAFDPKSGELSRIEPSIALSTTTDDVPVTTRGLISGVGVVVDKTGSAVGIIVRRGHSTWLLGKKSLARVIALTHGK